MLIYVRIVRKLWCEKIAHWEQMLIYRIMIKGLTWLGLWCRMWMWKQIELLSKCNEMVISVNKIGGEILRNNDYSHLGIGQPWKPTCYVADVVRVTAPHESMIKFTNHLLNNCWSISCWRARGSKQMIRTSSSSSTISPLCLFLFSYKKRLYSLRRFGQNFD